MHVSFSVPTLDERIWRATEPGTAPPRRRLEAVRVLSEAGIDTGVVAPVLPGLSDDPELLADVVRRRAAGASGVWANVLYLRPGTREHFLEALGRTGPSSFPSTSGSTRAAPTFPRARPSPCARPWACAHHVAPRRPPIAPAPEPEQLALVV